MFAGLAGAAFGVVTMVGIAHAQEVGPEAAAAYGQSGTQDAQDASLGGRLAPTPNASPSVITSAAPVRPPAGSSVPLARGLVDAAGAYVGHMGVALAIGPGLTGPDQVV